MVIDPGGAAAAAGAAAVGAAAGAAIGASMQAFAGAAAAGEFAINPDTGGKALLNAIRDMRDWIDENKGDLQQLARQPELGGSNGANTMRTFVPQVASDGQGFIPMLEKFRESLTSAEEGINSAIANYVSMDQRGAGRQQSS